MSKSEKRGGPFPEGALHNEAKLLGPYPTWDMWKQTLVKHFEISHLEKQAESTLAEWYRIRRLYQLEKIDFPEVRKDFELKHTEIFDNPQIVSFLSFITERTQLRGKEERVISKR